MAKQFGVHIGQQKARISELRSLWRWLDGVGMDWISVWDHLYEAPTEGGTQPHFEAVAILGAMAADTSRARLGCLVFCAPYRNVGLLAKSAITIDHLSDGRFVLGMGSGWYEEEATAFGLPFPAQRERFDVLEEQVEAVRAWLRGERLRVSGTHVRLEDAALLPGPAGPLPVWIGGTGRRRTLRLAAALADGWNAAYISAAEYRELNGVLDEWCGQVGRDPAGIERSVNLMFNLGNEDRGAAVRRLEAQWGERAARIRDGALLGRPEDVMDQVAPYIEAGADLVNIVIRPPWDQEVLAAYCTDVVPALRREWP
jgi:alkanesulfonate monooxygenase SsuD/methylene tetrahydromethanopterin reductase-like flavin-dependent oxidoreductase (luciferase family)